VLTHAFTCSDKLSGKDDSLQTRGTAGNLLPPILALGLRGSLSPATIIVFILVLATTRARVTQSLADPSAHP
jgi:hypothetical protein